MVTIDENGKASRSPLFSLDKRELRTKPTDYVSFKADQLILFATKPGEHRLVRLTFK